MHETEERGKLILNGKPMVLEAIARLLGLDLETTDQTLTRLLESGVASQNEEGVIYCRRMVREEGLRKIRSTAGKLGAPFGMLGGRPKKRQITANITAKEPLSQRQTKGQNNPPSSSSSSSSSSSDITTPIAPAPEGARVSGFDQFWQAYPRKVGKGAAEKIWRRIHGNGLLADVLAALEWQQTSDAWTKDGGQFIPHPATYLNQKRWQDEKLKTQEEIQKERIRKLEEESRRWQEAKAAKKAAEIVLAEAERKRIYDETTAQMEALNKKKTS